MKIYRVRHVLFDTIEWSEKKAKETVKELFFANEEDAGKSLSLYLENAKGNGRKYTDDPVEIEGLRGHYDSHIEAMVILEELEVFQRET